MRHRSIEFSKYEEMGAYHWAACERGSRNYSPPDEARYEVLVKRIEGATNVLDVGCGDGYLMARVGPLCDTVVGIDSEPAAINIARQKLGGHANCTPLLASCYELPFGGERFDLVLLAEVIEHLESPESCLQEIRRVLTRDGTLLLTTPNWWPNVVWDAKHHIKEYKPEELAALLTPWFSKVTLSFFGPAIWWWIRKRLGKVFVRIFARHFYNPFLAEGIDPGRFTGMLAVCQQPRSGPAEMSPQSRAP